MKFWRIFITGWKTTNGLIVLTGEVGTGKTTALRWILRRLDSSVLAAYIFNLRLSMDEFYQQVARMFGIKNWTNKAELLTEMGKVLEERHGRGLRTVLIVDEAHELSDYVLEEIRLLLNFESDDAKHLQIVLTGQPELREKLDQPNLRQLKQRVALRCKMHAFPNADETERYITERLLIAGAEQPNVFTPGAVDFIFQYSEGIPRLINNLCDNALLAACAARDAVVSRSMVEKVADNLDLLPRLRETFSTNEKPAAKINSGGVLTAEAREELWSNQNRPAIVRTSKKSATKIAEENGNSKPPSLYGSSDDEMNLEIGEIGGLY
jgi:type II secretory pathway predicted ATPase ExeA